MSGIRSFGPFSSPEEADGSRWAWPPVLTEALEREARIIGRPCWLSGATFQRIAHLASPCLYVLTIVLVPENMEVQGMEQHTVRVVSYVVDGDEPDVLGQHLGSSIAFVSMDRYYS